MFSFFAVVRWAFSLDGAADEDHGQHGENVGLHRPVSRSSAISGIGTSSPASDSTMPMMNTPLMTLPNRRTISEKVRVNVSTILSGIMTMLGWAKVLR